ncbi:MAG: hypothetical protein K2L97_06775, partial [Muribaculaceae bacterium]|nr:hypothetical protein [Muribaculaceae bacterium]
MTKFRLRGLTILIMAMLAALPLVSCGDDDEPPIPDNPITGGTGNNGSSGNGGGNSGSTAEIKTFTDVTCNYSDNYWRISITSTLEKEYPGKSIKYTLSFGSDDAEDFYSISGGGNDGSSFSKITSGDRTYVEIVQPFYYYYVAMCSINPSKESYYKDALTHCEMYLRSYRALASKSSLTSEERQLMSELKSYLNEYEREIRNNWGMIMVFRLRTELLERLKQLAAKDNRSLNNY